MFADYNFCGCTQTQTCPHTYYATSQMTNSWVSWTDYYWSLRPPRYEYVRPKPAPYYIPKPRPLPFKRVSGRGMIVRRVKPWNLRNH